MTVGDRVNAVLGKNITLSCIIEVGPNLSLTQTSWERRLPSGTVTLAVFNPEFGISISQDYERRVSFVSPSVRDATITISGASFADIGSYICKVTTFPLGNTQATTYVDVLGKAEPWHFFILPSSSPTCHIPKIRHRCLCANEVDTTAERFTWSDTERFGMLYSQKVYSIPNYCLERGHANANPSSGLQLWRSYSGSVALVSCDMWNTATLTLTECSPDICQHCYRICRHFLKAECRKTRSKKK